MTLKTNFDPNKFIASQKINVTRIGHVEVSTVRLHKLEGEIDRFETCLFADSGESMVVASYASRTEAIFGHGRLVTALRFYEKPEIG